MTQKPESELIDKPVKYAKAEKARRLMLAMEFLLEGRRPKEVKDILGLTYQDMLRVGLITKEAYYDKDGKKIGISPYYVCAVEE